MTPRPPAPWRDEVEGFFASPRLASALATAAIGTAILSWAIHNTIGWAGLVAILITLVVLCASSAWARRRSFDRIGLLPLSLLVFAVWASLSTFWSDYQWATVGGLAYLTVYSALGLYIALVRDTIQVIRAFGDVLRFVLVASFSVEILSGLLIDTPIAFIGVMGKLADGGPISGLIGNRNELGMIAVTAGLSFVIEWRTSSIRSSLAIGSLSLAAATLFFTRSPIAWGTAAVAVLALAVLYGIRQVDPSHRRFWQFGALGASLFAALLAWQLRGPIVAALNAAGELNYRLRLWNEIWTLVQARPVEGWGWIGQWNPGIPPYTLFGVQSGRASSSAVNAYLDVILQLGVIGFVLFIGVLGLAFVRSWLLASRKRSVVYTWSAIVLATVLTASLAESSVLIEFGWMIVVICCVMASQSLSWRSAFRRPLEQEPL